MMNKPKLLIKSALFLILCELAGFVINYFFPMCYQNFGAVMCWLFGFCSIGASLCIYADFCHKAGARANTKFSREGLTENTKHFGAVIGAVPAGINYIFVILLYLSKFGVLGFDFFPWYKTLTFYFMPITYIFAPNHLEFDEAGRSMSVSVPAAELSAGGMIVMTLLPLLFVLTCWAAFYIGYQHVDIKEKILYGGKGR